MDGRVGYAWFNPARYLSGIARALGSSGDGKAVLTNPAGRLSPQTLTIDLIRNMSRANPLWGDPSIHGELLKLGQAVAQRTVAKYMIPRVRRPPSQDWITFLRNHLASMVSVDFLIVPTLNFHLLYVSIVLSDGLHKIGQRLQIDIPHFQIVGLYQ